MRNQRCKLAIVTTDPALLSAIDQIADAFTGVLTHPIHVVSENSAPEFLGNQPTDPLQSQYTTRQLAVAAYQQVALQTDPDERIQPIGLAISLGKESDVQLVLHSQHETRQCSFQPNPNEQSTMAQTLTLMILSQHIDHPHEVSDDSSARWLHVRGEDDLKSLLATGSGFVGQCDQSPVLFPGSFSPLHEGHRQMVAFAAQYLERTVHLEICVSNADKPPLDYLTIQQRINQATSVGPVLLTLAPRFIDKAELFPQATFLIGADTALRLDHERYYENCRRKRDRALAELADRGCRFLVFGRLLQETFHDASVLSLSSRLRSLCEFVPQTEFRIDISSRQLRASTNAT